MYPQLVIDLRKIRENTRLVSATAEGIEVFAVTKGCCADAAVARAMLDGGVAGLADSRLTALKSLRKAFPNTPLLSLRQPMRDEIGALVELDLVAMVSDSGAAAALGAAARAAGCRQKVMVMIEVGDGREGVLPADFTSFAREVTASDNVDIVGIAANVGCRGGRPPTPELLTVLDILAAKAADAGIDIKIISAGNSSCWELLKTGRLPATASQMRFGEAILLGRQPPAGEPIEGTYQDAFIVRAEVLEVAVKDGARAAVAAIGCQDTGCGDLFPIDARSVVRRLTSDHCVVEVSADSKPACGDIFGFAPSYFALQALTASAYVERVYIGYNGESIAGN